MTIHLVYAGDLMIDNRGCFAEKALLVAVLQRAIMDAAGQCGLSLGEQAVTGVRNNARRWITYWDDEDEKYPMSFPWVCLHLDLNPKEVRKTAREFFEKRPDDLHNKGYANPVRYAEKMFSAAPRYEDVMTIYEAAK